MTLWLAGRYLTSGRQLFNVSSFFVIGGMALGVACLVVAMSVFSGFETTLVNSIIDFSGHADIVHRREEISLEDETKFLNSLPELYGKITGVTPYIELPAAVAHKGHIAGILLGGYSPESLSQVLNFSERLVQGEVLLGKARGEKMAKAVVGQGLARKFELRVGDKFKVIYPRNDSLQAQQGFRSTIGTFEVAGIIQLGMYDFDSRFVISSLSAIRELAGRPRALHGWKVKLEKREMTEGFIDSFRRKYDFPYGIRSWQSVNRTLVEAVQLEKPVIFLVILIMVIAAGFNVCCHLFVGVVKRYSDISILKAMGARRWQILLSFSLQGLILGAIGAVFGLFLGVALGHLFTWVQETWELMPSEVYKVQLAMVELRMQDVLWILLASILISGVSTLVPAWRGARLKPVEGLRYE